MAFDQLTSGLAKMNIKASQEQLDQLICYLELLQKWNKTYNLTAITDLQKMVSYHLLDSLSIVPAIAQRAQCLDVGTGAGLPGIPLAILLPQTQWVLLDSNGKKTRFIQQAIAACGLKNVKVVQSRIQDYHADSCFDVIVSRAYASLLNFIQSVDHLWQPETCLLTMKTDLTETERQQLDASHYQLKVTRLQVPGVAEKRSLVTIKRQKS